MGTLQSGVAMGREDRQDINKIRKGERMPDPNPAPDRRGERIVDSRLVGRGYKGRHRPGKHEAK